MIYDVAIVGGGIVGLATALALLTEQHVESVIVLDAEERVAAHQTGHNSGVIHAGLYYRPGSLKSRLCTEGRIRLYQFCAEQNIPHENCGKLVVALDAGGSRPAGYALRAGLGQRLAGAAADGR